MCRFAHPLVGLKSLTFCFLFILQTLLDRFDYDDEPEAGEESKKKDEMPSVQPTM